MDQVARTLAWMSNPARHHGQQATQLARKTLRAAAAHRLDFPGLLEACREFRRLRQAGIVAGAVLKSRTPPLHLRLPRTGTTATRISTEQDLERLGLEAWNCLAGLESGSSYRRRLRTEDIEFWRLGCPDANLLAVVLVDLSSDGVEEAKGRENQPLCSAGRAALIEFMGQRTLTVNVDASDLEENGICDEIVAATADSSLRYMDAFIGGRAYSLEIAQGAIAGRTFFANECWLLRQPDWARESLYTNSSDLFCSDEMGSGTTSVREPLMRHNLRMACRSDNALAQACQEAFADAPVYFRSDWFGHSGDLADVGQEHA
ncbi:hypothetical protein D9599_19405 [Roseomonas sp. KE2513]|uniref:hypothetical protein n=1 Tax=Roseomonas sp. KE2513 TaxID=2479202 RepID=UPI0018E052CC|nr:hypothetical protein [Roseomonas sp. KE2513]MBI0537732.1 hypothetical protein [Roseomonas sp. KE2513]